MSKPNIQKSHGSITNKIKLAFAILLTSLIAAACSDSSLSPINSKNNNNNNKPNQAHAVPSSFKLVKVTINGNGNGQASATATSISLQSGPKKVATSIGPPSGGNHGAAAGTIQLKPLTVTVFNSGSWGDPDASRYITATFAVRNADINGLAYTTQLKNMTWIAADNNSTIGETAVAQLQKYNGQPYPNASTFVNHMIPAGQVALNRFNKLVPVSVDVLQVFSETTVANIPVNNGLSLFPYGFAVVNSNDGGRTLQANPPANEYDGIITISFKMPMQSSFQNSRNAPYHYEFIFKPVVQTNTRITQAPEEQNQKGDKMLADHINNDIGLSNVNQIIVFPGSNFWQFPSKTKLRCTPVRVAGPAGSPITTLLSTSANNNVGMYPDSSNLGAEVTIHGCNLSGATVTVGGVSATVVTAESDATHLVFDVPTSLNILQSYDVEVTRSGNPTPNSAGDLYILGAIVGNASVYVSNVGGLNGVVDKDNVIDTDLTNYAHMSASLHLLGNVAVYLGVKYGGSTPIPAGGRAGFVIQNGGQNGGLLGASVLGHITITTYLNGQPQESTSSSGVLQLSLLSGSNKQFVGFKTTKPFDQIQITVGGTVDLGVDIDIYGAYADY